MNIDNVVQYILSMDAFTRSLVMIDANRGIFDRLYALISHVRRDDRRGSVGTIGVEIYIRLLHMSPNDAKTIAYGDCLFVENEVACNSRNCDRMCWFHTKWLYVAHNEAMNAIGESNVARMCIEYIQPGYHTIPKCILDDRALNKRKL
jgi:hypothetical protein